MRKFNVGDVVELIFLDHCTGSYPISGPVAIKTIGQVVEIHKGHVTISHWLYPNDMLDHNAEVSIIIKSTIKKVRVLKCSTKR